MKMQKQLKKPGKFHHLGFIGDYRLLKQSITAIKYDVLSQ